MRAGRPRSRGDPSWAPRAGETTSYRFAVRVLDRNAPVAAFVPPPPRLDRGLSPGSRGLALKGRVIRWMDWGKPIHAGVSYPPSPFFHSDFSSASTWPFTLTLPWTSAMWPSSSITKVERTIPMYFLPYMDFSCQAP